MTDINHISEVKIGLASPGDIRSWSHGEVKKPETINYRTLKPERDGLFCERIFGPTKDFECYCGHYKKPRFKGIVCERCGVEVTHSRVRRVRMGHIELAAPVAHIWYFKGVPSRIAYLLDFSSKDIEKIIYFASYVIIDVDTKRLNEDKEMLIKEHERELRELDERLERNIQEINEKYNAEIEETNKKLEVIESEKEKVKLTKELKKLERERNKEIKNLQTETEKRKKFLNRVLDTLINELKPKALIEDEELYRELEFRYGEYFEGGIGAEAIKKLLSKMDLEKEAAEIKEVIKKSRGQKRTDAIKRLKVINAFLESGQKPEWMILEVLPVLPPELRPMVQLDGGRFASSDLNDLYRRVINRNNRLKKLLDLKAPEIIVNNEKRMLQEAVDALFDNSKRQRPVTGASGRPLKSLSDYLKGKQGRFRQNLLGKRVDYSGRSVIVVNPELRLHQCGLPKIMALELFKPFVMRRLVELKHAENIKHAKKLIENQKPVVWDVLEEVIEDRAVLLNRAPTLHRLGIQAFEPKLVEGKAIQIHPLVCPPFNADFDGDQMAVHLPLSPHAQAEARILMLSTHNVLSPAHGKPLSLPSQDMILGIYWLTAESDKPEEEKGAGKVFASPDEAILAYDNKEISIHAPIQVRMNGWKGIEGRIETTVGRIIFNRALPDDWEYINSELIKKNISALVEKFAHRYGNVRLGEILDNIKEVGFKYATKPGITISMEDIPSAPDKERILAETKKKEQELEEQYQMGFIAQEEKFERIHTLRLEATNETINSLSRVFKKFNPLNMMVSSGARGSSSQVSQLAALRGLTADASGFIRAFITHNLKEGLPVLEYFLTTHGARKGLVDTALRTAQSGYLTRRLVDVSQDVIVREEDCGTTTGRPMKVISVNPLTKEKTYNEFILGRTALKDIVHPGTGEVIVEAGQFIDEEAKERIFEADIEEIYVRSPLTCLSKHGVCQKCYGWALADRRPVEVGEAIGIIAAQSIGEPGTQLTMRTFHVGGMAQSVEVDEKIRKEADEQVSMAREKEKRLLEEADEITTKIEIASEGARKIEKALAELAKSINREFKQVDKELKSLSFMSNGAEFDADKIIELAKAESLLRESGIKAFSRLGELNELLESIREEFVSKQRAKLESIEENIEALTQQNSFLQLPKKINEKLDAITSSIHDLISISKKTVAKLKPILSQIAGAEARELNKDEFKAIFGTIQPYIEAYENVIKQCDSAFTFLLERKRQLKKQIGYEEGASDTKVLTRLVEELKSCGICQKELKKPLEELKKALKDEDIETAVKVVDSIGTVLSQKIDSIQFEPAAEEDKELEATKELYDKVKKIHAVLNISRIAPLIEQAKEAAAAFNVVGDDEFIPGQIEHFRKINVFDSLKNIQILFNYLENLNPEKDTDVEIAENLSGLVKDLEAAYRELKKYSEFDELSIVLRDFVSRVKKLYSAPGRGTIGQSEEARISRISTNRTAALEMKERLLEKIEQGDKLLEDKPLPSTAEVSEHIQPMVEKIEQILADSEEINRISEVLHDESEKCLRDFQQNANLAADVKQRLAESRRVKREIEAEIKKWKEELNRLWPEINEIFNTNLEAIATQGEKSEFVKNFERIKSEVEKLEEKESDREKAVKLLERAKEVLTNYTGFLKSAESAVKETAKSLNDRVNEMAEELKKRALKLKKEAKTVVSIAEEERNRLLSEAFRETTSITSSLTGLPRAVEIFEARRPANSAVLADVSGTVYIVEEQGKQMLKLVSTTGREHYYNLPRGVKIRVKNGQKVEAGDKLTEGDIDPHRLLEIKGIQETQLYIINAIQDVYRQQGVDLDDKHVEIIVRQMTRRVQIQNPGDSGYLPNQLVDRLELEDVNRKLREEGKRPATAKPVLMGITKAALATESWLSAASFQETTRVLAEASIRGKSDPLLGLKENVIIGKLIPAGTGAPQHKKYVPGFPHLAEMAEKLAKEAPAAAPGDEDKELEEFAKLDVDLLDAEIKALMEQGEEESKDEKEKEE